MENDSLKSMWKGVATADKSSLELQTIIKERGHSLLKRVRRQLIIEAIGMGAFLIVYYDFFDGHRKPFFANVLLVAALLLVIIHNIFGYMQLKSRESGGNIEQILSKRLSKMKVYAVIAGTLRILAAASFLFFFMSVIPFSQVKYWILAGVIFIFLIQMAVFFKIWNVRIEGMKQVVNSLRADF